jgi:signal transduction histidine kinase
VPELTDLALAVAAYAATIGLMHAAHDAKRGLDAPGALIAAAACAPLVARRRAPLAVFALTTGASATLNALGYGLGPPFGPTIALFFVAADERTRTRMRETAAAVVGLFLLHVGSTLVAHAGFPTSPVSFGVIVWGGAWIAGDQVRQRRQRAALAGERARRAEHDLQRERRIAVAEERTRIARDLHDSAAHAINVILVQAGAARLLQHDDPAAATRALTTIEDVARETIDEIDQLVRTLREDAGPGVEPPAGLAALATLTERVGVAVELRREGEPRPLPAAVDRAAYRILQESLTNAARHGDGTIAITVRYLPGGLELVAENPLAAGAPAEPAESHGILGMRERAELVGGTLEAGRAGGRFRVRAVLPAEGRPA